MEAKASNTFNAITSFTMALLVNKKIENVGEPNPHMTSAALKLYCSCNTLYASCIGGINTSGSLCRQHRWMKTYF